MTVCFVVNANVLYTLIQLDNSKHRSRAISTLFEDRKIHILSCNIDYPDPMSPTFAFTTQHRGSWAHARLPSAKNVKKIFPQKTHRDTCDERKRQETDLTLRNWRFRGKSLRGSLIRLRLHKVTCLASLYVGRQHRTNNEPYKMAMN